MRPDLEYEVESESRYDSVLLHGWEATICRDCSGERQLVVVRDLDQHEREHRNRRSASASRVSGITQGADAFVLAPRSRRGA